MSIRALINDERGQDVFDYLLVTGAASIVIIAILIAGFVFVVPQVVGHSCPAVDPLHSEAAGECLEPSSP